MTIPFPDVTVILGDPRLGDSYKAGGTYGEEDLDNVERLKQALLGLDGYRFRFLDDHTSLVRTLVESPPEFVLNLCDTGFRNHSAHELNIPALLELLDVPYSGATPSCMVLTLDKAIVRSVAAELGIPVPRETFIEIQGRPDIEGFRFPALVKPAKTDGSLGITQDAVVDTPDAAWDYIERVRAQLPGENLLLQEYLPGTEYGVGLVGNGDRIEAFPPLRVDYDALDPALPRILGYESKALPGSPYWTDIRIVPANIDDDLRNHLVRQARLLFERFGFRDYGRFDFRTDTAGTVRLMEVNANPAWSWDGKLAFMAGFAGLDYTAFIRLLLETAQRRVASERGMR